MGPMMGMGPMGYMPQYQHHQPAPLIAEAPKEEVKEPMVSEPKEEEVKQKETKDMTDEEYRAALFENT